MQAPTHILVGVLIQKGFESKKHPRVALVLTAICAFLSHGILDKLANLTYHRAKPDFHSFIWVTYHAALVVVTILFLYWWWKPYKWGIIFACLPDLDWVFIHGQAILGIKLPFYREAHLHHLVGGIIHQMPFLSWLDKLPNYRNNPWAILPEVAVVATIVILLRGRKSKVSKA